MSENVRFLAGALFVVGSTLVVTSMWALGVTGTYLGRHANHQYQLVCVVILANAKLLHSISR